MRKSQFLEMVTSSFLWAWVTIFLPDSNFKHLNFLFQWIFSVIVFCDLMKQYACVCCGDHGYCYDYIRCCARLWCCVLLDYSSAIYNCCDVFFLGDMSVQLAILYFLYKPILFGYYLLYLYFYWLFSRKILPYIKISWYLAFFNIGKLETSCKIKWQPNVVGLQ